MFRSLCSVSGLAALLVSGAALAAQPPAEKKEPAKETPAKAEQPAKAPAAAEPAKKEEAKPAPAEDKVVLVNVSTSMGDIVLELNETRAPISVANFLSYADKGHYNGTIFHRVMDGFMIQGGGHTADGKAKPTDPPIKNEWQNGLKNKRGTVAMARTAIPDSATSQFFINVVDNAGLDMARGGAAYAVFGRVVSGMDVVDKIKAVKTNKPVPDASGRMTLPNDKLMPDQPLEPVTINSVTRVQGK